ncbi:MAG TPA: rhodanese-like domain-containing protein [Polyangiaceae bacterium]|nr:rhodanese-like domain-containing protein [Polyangiaceae bacterium]
MFENAPTEISLQDLKSSLASPQPPIVAEILGPAYFAQGHLPGAVNLPLEGFAESAARLLPDKAADIVVYCASQTCQNSDIAQRKLQSLGYCNVRVFKGGKAAWSAAGQPLIAA